MLGVRERFVMKLNSLFFGRLFMLILNDLNEFKFPDDPEQRKDMLKLNDKPQIKKNFLSLLQDVLLLPYGVTPDQDVPPGMSAYSFKRVTANNWKAEELERVIMQWSKRMFKEFVLF